MKILTGLLLIAGGIAIIRYRFAIYEFTGEWDWANKYLSSTMVAIVMIGMLLIGAGAAYPFGVFDHMNDGPIVVQQNSPSSSK